MREWKYMPISLSAMPEGTNGGALPEGTNGDALAVLDDRTEVMCAGGGPG